VALSLFSAIYGQEAEIAKYNRIKGDPAYIWGEGEHQYAEEAKKLALQALLNKIQVSIVSKIDETYKEQLTETGATFTQDFLRTHKSYSGLYLKGLDYISYQDRKLWKSLAFIQRDSLATSFELRKAKIIGYVQSGLSAANHGYAGECLRNYFWGYLLAKTYPDTIRLPAPIGDLSPVPAVALTNALNSALQDLQFRAGSSYIDGDVVIAPLTSTFRKKPTLGISFNYYNGIGTQWDFVDDGATRLTLYFQPTSSEQKITLNINYAYDTQMGFDPEIQEIYDIFKEEVEFKNMKNVDLYFPFVKQEAGMTAQNEPAPDEISPPAPVRVYEPPKIDIAEPSRSKDFNNILMTLNEQSNSADFLEVLDQYRKLGYIKYGKKEDFPDSKGYIAVVDEKITYSILYCNGAKYIDICSGKVWEDLQTFKGKRQVWFVGLK
jgi:hypothetical protein